MQKDLTRFYQHLHTIHHLRSLEALLDWDQQVMLPDEGATWRASQLSFIAELLHRELTSEPFFDITSTLATRLNDLSEDDVVNVRETLYKMERQRKLPTKLVVEKAKVTSETFHLWLEAKANDSFSTVAESLSRLVELSIQEARCTVISDNLYDSLLDVYEPGARIAEIAPLLMNTADELTGFLPEIIKRQGEVDAVDGKFPRADQEKLCSCIAQQLGFSFSSGRLDTAAHPFQTSLGPKDYRITTRWDETDFFPALFGVIHEVGHALYEQGLPEKWHGTPRGSHVSLGIHESQSRFWENMIGRSSAFSHYLSVHIKDYLNVTLTPELIWKCSNRVAPSLNRVEADEATYTLHIVIRMILEERLIRGSLTVRELPEAWHELYERYLGVRSTTDRDGVLQDIHWYSGSIGYFPTYALGNLYSAMLLNTLTKDLGDIWGRVRIGEFAPILQWMKDKVHEPGMTYRGPELIKKISGSPLSNDPFVQYIKEKFLP